MILFLLNLFPRFVSGDLRWDDCGSETSVLRLLILWILLIMSSKYNSLNIKHHKFRYKTTASLFFSLDASLNFFLQLHSRLFLHFLIRGTSFSIFSIELLCYCFYHSDEGSWFLFFDVIKTIFICRFTLLIS